MQTKTTTAMEAKAANLLAESYRWTRGTRKADGLSFVIFPSTTPGIGHMTSQFGCTCKSWAYRQACSHHAAVMAEVEQARAVVEVSTRRSYSDLFRGDGSGLEDSF